MPHESGVARSDGDVGPTSSGLKGARGFCIIRFLTLRAAAARH
jgi:hypothetical protein